MVGLGGGRRRPRSASPWRSGRLLGGPRTVRGDRSGPWACERGRRHARSTIRERPKRGQTRPATRARTTTSAPSRTTSRTDSRTDCDAVGRGAILHHRAGRTRRHATRREGSGHFPLPVVRGGALLLGSDSHTPCHRFRTQAVDNRVDRDIGRPARATARAAPQGADRGAQEQSGTGESVSDTGVDYGDVWQQTLGTLDGQGHLPPGAGLRPAVPPRRRARRDRPGQGAETYTKDFLETRIRAGVVEALTGHLGIPVQLAVSVDESLEHDSGLITGEPTGQPALGDPGRHLHSVRPGRCPPRPR